MSLPSASPILCDSRITHVTVYARGALVTRKLLLPANRGLPDGDIEIAVDGITPIAEPGSLRATLHLAEAQQAAAGGRQIVAVRSVLAVPETPAAPPESLSRVQEIALRLGRVQSFAARLQELRQALQSAVPDPALRTASFLEKADERLADAIATSELLCETQAEVDARLGVLEQEIVELQQARAAAELAHSQARSHLGPGHPTRRAIICLCGSGPIGELTLSYVVPPARFWLLYTLRVSDGRESRDPRESKESTRRASFAIEALLAQKTGEDWRGVRLSLSTADLLLDARLPELPSLRIGRAQPPPRRGYRPPPEGLDALFAGYDQAFVKDGVALSGAALPEKARNTGELERLRVEEVFDGSARDKDWRYSEGAVAPGAMPPLMAAAPKPPALALPMEPQGRARRLSGTAPPRGGGAMKERSEHATTLSDGLLGGGYGGGAEETGERFAAVPSLEPQDAWLDFDRLILARPEDRTRRGRLARISESASLTGGYQASQEIESLRPAEGLGDPLTARGHFDHRYDAEGLVLVPADGLPHRVVIMSAVSQPTLRLIAVPRERPEVYREAELKNPCEAPLLAGPVDVYVEGSLLSTATIAAIDRGGSLNIGMGVEERVRVARNVRSDEETVGLLGGSTQINHAVSIELSSALGQQCVIEVFERLPISDDKAVAVELLAARPEPKEYTQAERGAPIRGGLLWRLLLPAGGKAKIEYQYRILFPAKTEIVGGNRRD